MAFIKLTMEEERSFSKVHFGIFISLTGKAKTVLSDTIDCFYSIPAIVPILWFGALKYF